MKSLRESREDRLARLAARRRRVFKITPAALARIEKKVHKAFKKFGEELCPHGIGFRGHSCFVCSADRIANELREQWSPTPTYLAHIYVADGEEFSCLTLKLKTRNPTQKIMEMNKNGFWYIFAGKPVYMTPNMIKVVQLDDMVQNPGYTDPEETDDPEEDEEIRSARR